MLQANYKILIHKYIYRIAHKCVHPNQFYLNKNLFYFNTEAIQKAGAVKYADYTPAEE